MIYEQENDTFDQSYLRDSQHLQEPDDLEDDFVTVYQKAIDFADILVDASTHAIIKTAFTDFAQELAGDEDAGFDVRTSLWAGYHPTLILFRRLEFYGLRGLYHYKDGDIPAQSTALQTELRLAVEFHDWLPTNWLPSSESGGKGRIGEVLHAAQARFALDTGDDLTLDQIVVLAGMSRRSVQNALSSKDEAGLRANSEGQIANTEALRWLEGRRNFTPTSLYRGEPDEAPTEQVAVSPSEPLDYVFVPAADDGSQFRPTMFRTQGYQIGAKGEEIYMTDYFAALDALQSMRTARWRRPNAAGNWGIVTAIHWVRIPKDELLAELARATA